MHMFSLRNHVAIALGVVSCYLCTFLECLAAAASFDTVPSEGDLPPGSVITPEAVARFKATIAARMNGFSDTAPDKLEDQWTISKTFRDDLENQLVDFAENLTVLEVGSYFGYTTRLLSRYFKRVIALDAMPALLQANREYNRDRDNILYLKFHTLENDWGLFAENEIHVIFLDASHDYETVRVDLENCLRLPTASLIIFDDYGAETGVRQVVHEFVARGRLRPVAFFGEGARGAWQLRDGRTVSEREAVACEVVRGEAGVVAKASDVGSRGAGCQNDDGECGTRQ